MSKTVKWIIAIIVIIIVIAGVWYWWGGSDVSSTERGPIRIGLSAPLTGEVSSWGQNTLAAATLAVKEANDRGGINGRKIELISEDDKSNGVDAVNAFNKLINVDKVDGIIGPVTSVAAGSALPIAQKSGTPVVMLASAPALTSVGDYMFRIYPADSYQGIFGAEIVYNKLAKKKVAVINIKNDYGDGLAKSFVDRYKELGGEIVMQEPILNESTDFRSVIAKAKNSGADALYLVIYPKAGLLLTKQMKEAKLDLPKVGDLMFNDENIIKSGNAEGIIFTEAKSDLEKAFVAKIKAQPAFKDLEVMAAAPFAYDATNALLDAIAKTGSDDRPKIKENLARVSFPGASVSKVEFGVDREIKNPAFNIKMIKDKAVVDYGN